MLLFSMISMNLKPDLTEPNRLLEKVTTICRLLPDHDTDRRVRFIVRMCCFLCFTSAVSNKLYYTGDEPTDHLTS